MPDEAPVEEAPEYTHFMQWVREQGVTIDGIESIAQPGRGRGIFTTRDVKQGELLANVPTKCILTVPRSPRKNETVQGRLAARLLADAQERIAPWFSVMPSFEDLRDCMPLMWPQETQNLLPEAALTLLQKQQAKFEVDWQMFLKPEYEFSYHKLSIHITDDKLRDQYMYCWLLVNTRCFYWDFPTGGSTVSKSKRGHGSSKIKLPDSECMALCPFMDFFNHDNAGIQASYNKTGYFFTADRDYAAGEELLFSYGSYTNDFLLVEYGFILSMSDSDGVTIDSVILPLLNMQQKEDLKDAQMLGQYVLSLPTQLCHRTQCALRASLVPARQFNRFVRGESDGEKEQPAVSRLARECLLKYRDEVARERIRQLTSPPLKSTVGATSCLNRWYQLEQILTQACEDLRSDG